MRHAPFATIRRHARRTRPPHTPATPVPRRAAPARGDHMCMATLARDTCAPPVRAHPPRPVPPPSDVYLEELVDTAPEADRAAQTDEFLERPATPPFVPQKPGADAATQIEPGALRPPAAARGVRGRGRLPERRALMLRHMCAGTVLPGAHPYSPRASHGRPPLGDLFDFDLEVEPLLEVLVGKVLEQGLMEVLQEEELAAMRRHQVCVCACVWGGALGGRTLVW